MFLKMEKFRVMTWTIVALVLIESASQISSLPLGGITSSRHKRTIPDEADAQLLVDLHNTFRRQEGASDMEHMVQTPIV